ncbi:DEAD/DEAH box helicase [Sulfurimonas sp. HSL1-2]|uniref:DEAD/DEAH box helicase n=1 Tax=Thiomicrolovo zhangzhouensis TaxID=3131933 RepID=UPI0031F98204
MQAKLYAYLKKGGLPDVLICEDAAEAQQLRDLCRFKEIDAVVLPDFRATWLDDLRPFSEELSQMAEALRHYYEADKKPLVIAPFKSLLFPLPKTHLLRTKQIAFGDRLDLGALKTELLHWGYSFVDLVEVEGEVSFRGDIIDVFAPGTESPYRISLFDDEIEQIKAFEVETQRTVGEELEGFELHSAPYAFDEAGYERIVAAVEASTSDSFVKDIDSLGFWYLGDDAENFLEGKKVAAVKRLDAMIGEAYTLNTPQVPQGVFESVAVLPEDDRVKALAVTDVKTLLEVHPNKKVTIIASSDAQLKQAGLFDTRGLTVKRSGEIVNLITDTELIISLNKPVRKKRRRKSSLLLDDLKPGDYVVHEDHGVGIFEAIEQAEILGSVRDFIAIRYQGDERVLLPVENLDAIDRYIAGAGAPPVLDRLGKGSFGRLKETVRKRLFEIASEIVNTAAQRALISAPVIETDAKKLAAFQAEAGFEYTEDQARSIAEIIAEIGSGLVMDRLLSGDVGFGKTEVAMNAMFAAAQAGYQSAVIVPTTLLSSQHFASLKARFAEYDFRIAKIDRFVTPKVKKAVEAGLAEGTIDMVVGTHALFGTKFAKLGLVVIDEEHKFGVKQKEKLKTLYEKTHLLTMSATPIPRSLNQALSSIKTLSTLMTPPGERQGVRTFVKAYDEKLVKEVILRELRRGGQVFYVYNSIDHMPIKLGELKAILPDLRILMLHSQVGAVETEKELLKFQDGEYDLMLATSIIESGIHMPRVNTMIIDGADRFGIADLHQLRGRVGRGHTEGYAYFIVEDKELITEEAKKRLIALESNSFLGSGSVLAYHDLEIRGGGNLVGDAQSGHIKNIGYSLYLRMLEDAIKELSNKKETPKAKVDLKLAVSAYISDELVAEDRLRLELYRRLSLCETPTEVYEIEEEVTERFGRPDGPTKQFFELMVIKLMGLEKHIKMLSSYGQNITVEYLSGAKEYVTADSKDDDDIIKAVLHYLRTAKPKVL